MAKPAQLLPQRPNAGVGHVNDYEVPLISLETGQIAVIKVSASIPLDGEDRMFLMRLAFGDIHSRAILWAYLSHAVIKSVYTGEGTNGVTFYCGEELAGREWWLAKLEDSEFGTVSGSVRSGDKIIIYFSKGTIDKEWVPFTRDTLDEWWNLVDKKHQISQLDFPTNGGRATGLIKTGLERFGAQVA